MYCILAIANCYEGGFSSSATEQKTMVVRPVFGYCNLDVRVLFLFKSSLYSNQVFLCTPYVNTKITPMCGAFILKIKLVFK